MRTRINQDYTAGLLAGLRMAALIVSGLSRAGQGSSFAAAIMRRHTDTALALEAWKNKGIAS